MAVKLIANYAKRLGLPGYSSHQFSVSVETELMNVEDIAGESARLYSMLQASVDEQVQQTGFVPPDGYGLNGASNGHMKPLNGNSDRREYTRESGNGRPFSEWRCSEGQRGFILRLVEENGLSKDDVEALSQQLFNVGVKQVDKMQASQLIEELLEKTGRKGTGNRGGHYRRAEVRK